MDIGRMTKVVQALKAFLWTVTTNLSAAIDTLGFKEVLVIVNAGTVGSSGTVDITVTESDATGGTYTLITGATFTQITAANDDAVYVGRIRMTPTRKRFLKISAIVGTAACTFGVVAVLGEAEAEPAQTPVFDIHT